MYSSQFCELTARTELNPSTTLASERVLFLLGSMFEVVGKEYQVREVRSSITYAEVLPGNVRPKYVRSSSFLGGSSSSRFLGSFYHYLHSLPVVF